MKNSQPLRKEGYMEREERQAIYQVSTLQALARGNYYGSTDMETLLLHGDTGLGTFHAVAGELIVIDGHAYRVLGDGSAVEAAQTDTTPFATVTWLRHQEPVLLKHQPSIEALKES
jgi:acetolactate decarboxylase